MKMSKWTMMKIQVSTETPMNMVEACPEIMWVQKDKITVLMVTLKALLRYMVKMNWKCTRRKLSMRSENS